MLSEGIHHSFRANLVKAVIELRRYLPNTVSMIVTFYAIFLFLLFGVRFVGDPGTADDAVRYLLVANGFWFLLMMSVNAMGWELTTEALRGTLEQLYLGTVPPWLILLFRMVATIFLNIVILAVLMALSMLTAGTWLQVDLGALAVLLPPTLLAAVGLSYAVAGLTIVYKQVNAFLQLSQFALMAIAYVPLAQVPLLELAPRPRASTWSGGCWPRARRSRRSRPPTGLRCGRRAPSTSPWASSRSSSASAAPWRAGC